MTLAAAAVTGRDRTEMRRWGASLLVVLALHVAAALYLLSRQVPLTAAGPPPSAVMIDLAPLPASAPSRPAPLEPVEQPQPLAQIEPAPPPPLVVPLFKVEPSPAPKPAMALPKSPPRAKPKPRPRPPEPPAEPPPAPPPRPAAPIVTAPAAPAAPAPPAAPVPPATAGISRADWQAKLVGWLERYKRYPRLAREQRQEGTVHLRFTIDRSGRVLASRIDQGSGFALLDEEVAALLQRAQPLPPPPPEVAGSQITLSLPVQFRLRPGER